MNHRRIGIASVVVALALTSVAAPALAVDSRELKAREAFAAGRYQEALEMFAKLYAETLHPIYLRNIGRCYQNLGEPDQAIISFREYLRKAKNLRAEERAEIEGYIAEMEELKKQKEAAATAATPATGPPKPASAITSLSVAPQPATDARARGARDRSRRAGGASRRRRSTRAGGSGRSSPARRSARRSVWRPRRAR